METIKNLLGKVPFFGIGLGHLLLGRALGAATMRMKVGHHGDNQPVRDCVRGRLDITSQHHSFVLVADASTSGVFEITHRNVNDESVEGFRATSQGVISTQYYPRITGVDHVDDAWQEFEQTLT